MGGCFVGGMGRGIGGGLSGGYRVGGGGCGGVWVGGRGRSGEEGCGLETFGRVRKARGMSNWLRRAGG